MTRSTNAPVWHPANFFVLRTPLLPFAAVDAWGGALEAPLATEASGEALGAALERDRARAVERVRALVADPIVREALFVASPSLDEALRRWLDDPAHPRAHGVLETVARYLFRMAARATPFGLFSGSSLGRTSHTTALSVAPRAEARRRTRLDTHYLCALTEALEGDPPLRDRLRYSPSSALYPCAEQLRYAEGRVEAVSRVRRNDVVSVERSPAVEAALSRARDGALPAEIARHIVDVIEGVTEDEARAFVDTLIDSQILVSNLSPPVTGDEPARVVCATLREARSPSADALGDAMDALTALDRAGPGRAPAEYLAVRDRLTALPAETELARLFQVDLYKPAPDATLGGAAIDELTRAITTLASITPAEPDEALQRFRARLAERWGGGEVRLTEALDEERGIGFSDEFLAMDASPLIQGMPFPDASETAKSAFGARERWLLWRLEETVAEGRIEWSLDARDLAALAVRDAPPLPDAYAAIATYAARSPEALAAGEFSLRLQAVTGPSGATLMGRFCLGDDALRARVEEHLRAEESLRPDAVFAEVAHLPEGRVGNVIARPVLRAYEIPYLGRSGAPVERQITLDDLWVSVPGKAGERVVLRSERLDREVLPRLTTAHNTTTGLTVYRFLTALGHQGARRGLFWSWGPLAGARFLPRVRCGRAVFSLAQWRLTADDLRPLLGATGPERYLAAQALRTTLRLPRRVCVVDGDNVLPIDLDDVVSVDVFASLVKSRRAVVLEEQFSGPDALCASASDGAYAHEVVIPFTRAAPPSATGSKPALVHRTGLPRAFPPGSPWLFAKIYTGTLTADRVLTEALRPVIADALATGAADRWFFIRYVDPHWHLRVRLHGQPERLWAEVLPKLHAALTPWLADGRVARWALDTYDRETERYGGDAGIELSEAVFCADSEAVADIVALLEGDDGAVARWRLAARGLRDLLRDLGLDRARRISVLERLRADFWVRHRGDVALDRAMGQRFREERAELEALFAATADSDHPYAPAVAAFDRRRAVIGPLASQFASAPLLAPLDEIADSYVHMFVNRMLRSEHNAQELVLYDFALRLERSALVRGQVEVS